MKLGLTGSIGMGKTTVSQIFADEGVEIWNADLVVKGLYASDQGLFELVEKLAPSAVSDKIDFDVLRALIRDDDSIIDRLEAYIHPKVRDNRNVFLSKKDGIKLCDIPLLYENDIAKEFDYVIVVSAPFEVQLERVMKRSTMTRPVFDMILSRQMPDEEKRKRADFVIDTNTSLENTRAQVQAILKNIGVQNA